MERLLELNPNLRKHMPRKQSGEPLFNERPKKRGIFASKLANAIYIRPPKPTIESHLNQLLLAYGQKDHARVLKSAQAIVGRRQLPPTVIMILLKVSLLINSPKILRQVLFNHEFHQMNFDAVDLVEILVDAIKEGKEEITATLMRYAADLSNRKCNHDSLMHEILRSKKIETVGKREELVRKMLDYGAKVNVYDKVVYSLLHDAIIHCSSEFVEELLQRGAKVHINQTCNDLNDIHLAVCHKPELVPRLIQHRAKNENSRNKIGVLAIDYLISQQHTGDKAVSTVQVVKKILDLGVPVIQEQDGQPQCPFLNTALFYKKEKVINFLLEHSADWQHKDELQCTPVFHSTIVKKQTVHIHQSSF